MDNEAALSNHDVALADASSPRFEARMEAMFKRDCIAAGLLVVALWIIVSFVMLAMRPFMPGGAVEIVCWIGAALLLLFNSASIFAMIRHYSEDKRHIYGVDIRHLDAGR